MQRTSLWSARLLVTAITLAFICAAPAQAQPSDCQTICLRGPQYYLQRLGQLPDGLILLSGGGPLGSIHTDNRTQMKLALDGGNSAQDRFNQQFVTLQLNLLATPGRDEAALQSPLSCYGLNFDAINFNFGLSISSNSSLGYLVSAGNLLRYGNTADLERAAAIMAQVIGNDPLGGCRTPTPSSFPAATVQQLDALIEEQMTAQNLPGVVVGVWAPGQGTYVTAKGTANLATGTTRNITDPFRIASITKTFVATAVLQLVDQGLLKTTDKLARWFPDFPNAEQITIDDLLRMRSGIADSADAEFLARVYEDPLLDLRPADHFARSAARRSEFIAPDQKTIYTNVNTIFLQEIIERITGRSLGAVITDGILKPLGLSNTSYPYNTELAGNLRGYSFNPQTNVFEDKTVLNPGWAGGAGAMISNLADLRVYARALATGALLKPETHQARLRSQTLEGLPDFVRYGGGIEQIGQFYGHNGTIFGFSTEMFYLPAKDAVIVVSVNRLDLDDHSKSTDLFLLIAELLFPEHVDWR